ncbi:hypothetical protein CAMRE0001_0108 [Campylobacter rectus RM3267]|uniref:Uncharacterized protein n=1 Tax=Campylobacter rectus RM3267 TaxID=553218 RepID=B9CXP4_CAMRE|nr:hypothetical protein CAMRE0001_0108 [Campylobacter rectus RM3267]
MCGEFVGGLNLSGLNLKLRLQDRFKLRNDDILNFSSRCACNF